MMDFPLNTLEWSAKQRLEYILETEEMKMVLEEQKYLSAHQLFRFFELLHLVCSQSSQFLRDNAINLKAHQKMSEETT